MGILELMSRGSGLDGFDLNQASVLLRNNGPGLRGCAHLPPQGTENASLQIYDSIQVV